MERARVACLILAEFGVAKGCVYARLIVKFFLCMHVREIPRKHKLFCGLCIGNPVWDGRKYGSYLTLSRPLREIVCIGLNLYSLSREVRVLARGMYLH